MDQQEINRTVEGLHHYVIDVWDWYALQGIVKEYVGTVIDIDQGHQGELAAKRRITAKARVHLAAKYAEAIAEVDRVTDLLRQEPDTIGTALLQRVRTDLNRLGLATVCEEQWAAHQPFEPVVWDQEDPTEEELKAYENRGPEPVWEEEFPGHPRPWVFIASELAPFACNVAERIDERMRNEVEPDSAVPVKGPRPRWDGSASELAYLLTELVEADHLIPPPNGRRTGKNGNRAAIAQAIYTAFDIRDKDTGEPVTMEYFKSLMRPKSPDRGTFIKLFLIRRRTA